MALTLDVCAVGVGAVCGALSRYQIGRVAAAAATDSAAVATGRSSSSTSSLSSSPLWHTAGINVLGSFVLGGVVGSADTAAGGPLTPRHRLSLGVGFCGSFTTFSTYAVDVVGMLGRGEAWRAVAFVVTNNVGSVAAAGAGMMLAKRLLSASSKHHKGRR